MSNFPYNNDRYEYNEDVNGSPLTLAEARAWADKILYWHTNNDTADFSQSGDGFDEGVEDFAFGLLELFSDPNAVKRLKTTGKEVKAEVYLIYNTKVNIPRWEKIKETLNPIFGLPTQKSIDKT